MKEKFTKLFGALILLAFVLGLVLPFQTAAAEEIAGTSTLAVVATDGDTTFAGVNVTLTGNFTTGTPTHYTLERSTTESGAKTAITIPLTAPVNGGDLAVTDTNAVKGRVYWYWGRICDATSCSAYVNDTGYRAVLSVPVSFVATENYDGIAFVITPNATALDLTVAGNSYKIYRKSHAAATWSTTPLATITALVYNDTTARGRLLDGTPPGEYDYMVDACGPDRCQSQDDTAVTLLSTPPANALAATATGLHRTTPATAADFSTTEGTVTGMVTATWTPNTAGAETYYAERRFGAETMPGTPVTFSRTVGTGNDTFAVAGRVYTYAIWACSLGTENCSPEVTHTGWVAETLPVVSGLTASDGTVTDLGGNPVIEVRWSAVTYPLGAAGGAVTTYNVFRSDNAAGTVGVVTFAGAVPQVAGATLNYVDDNVDIGKSYWYWVQAVNGAGPGAISNRDEGWAPIPAPTVTIGAASSTGVSASWTEVDINATYLGFRSPNTSFASAIPTAGVSITGLSGTDTSGTAGVTYWYFIKACIADRCSLPSTAVSGIKLLP